MNTFADAQFMTAEDKRLTLKAWATFIKHGFQFKHFSNRLYDHLIQHCSFIAHYNRLGFYDTYFNRPVDTLKFLTQFDRDLGCVSVEYGYDGWCKDSDYIDLAKAMVDVLAPLLPGIRSRLRGGNLAIAEAELQAAQEKVAALRGA